MIITEELNNQLKSAVKALLDDEGRELHNPTPIVARFDVRPRSLQQQVQRIIALQLSLQARAQERETFAEANDFDAEEPDDPFESLEIMEPDPVMEAVESGTPVEEEVKPEQSDLAESDSPS